MSKIYIDGKLNYKMFRMSDADAKYFWKHMRKEDKLECEIKGVTYKDFYNATKEQGTDAYSFAVGGKKVCIGGFSKACAKTPNVPDLLIFWFFCSPRFKKYAMPLTKVIRTFVENTGRDMRYVTYKKVVRVWSGHKEAVRWVQLLGFRRLICAQQLGNSGTFIYTLELGKKQTKSIKDQINDKYGRVVITE